MQASTSRRPQRRAPSIGRTRGRAALEPCNRADYYSPRKTTVLAVAIRRYKRLERCGSSSTKPLGPPSCSKRTALNGAWGVLDSELASETGTASDPTHATRLGPAKRLRGSDNTRLRAVARISCAVLEGLALKAARSATLMIASVAAATPPRLRQARTLRAEVLRRNAQPRQNGNSRPQVLRPALSSATGDGFGR